MVGSLSSAVGLRARLDPATWARKGLKALSAATDRLSEPLEGPRMLIYHQVAAGNGVEMDLAGDDFEKQMAWLASTGGVRRLEDVIDDLDTVRTEYVITFDDGYQDMYLNGYPLLAELGLPFTLYLTTDPIEARRPLRDDGRSVPITWDQVDDMLSSGLVTIGAHTHTHPDLRTLSDAAIEDEIGRSNELIERRTGVAPEHFTYPWAYWSGPADRIIRRVYRSATVGGSASTRFASPFAIPRLPVQLSDGWTFFRPRLRGGFRLEDKLRRSITRYEGP